jgi:hypothetical protein
VVQQDVLQPAPDLVGVEGVCDSSSFPLMTSRGVKGSPAVSFDSSAKRRISSSKTPRTCAGSRRCGPGRPTPPAADGRARRRAEHHATSACPGSAGAVGLNAPLRPPESTTDIRLRDLSLQHVTSEANRDPESPWG